MGSRKLWQQQWPQRATWIAVGLLMGAIGSPYLAQQISEQSDLVLAQSSDVGYRILVDSTDPYVLEQVKRVSANAFFQPFTDGRTRIQAGFFQQESDAWQRITALNAIGISAGIYPPGSPAPVSQAPVTTTQPYYQAPVTTTQPYYQAPVTTTQPYYTAPVMPAVSSAEMGYRVVVDSADPYVLEQVKQVSPNAYLQPFSDGRTRIQAGFFKLESGAWQRVAALNAIGISATVYPSGSSVASMAPPSGTQIYYPTGSGTSMPPVSSSKISGYYVVIPGQRDELWTVYNRLISLGIPAQTLAFGQQPLGWNVSIGVYQNEGDAKKMNQYLQSKGFANVRMHFQP
jgi:hypothetical protein